MFILQEALQWCHRSHSHVLLLNSDVCVWRLHMRRNPEQHCSKRQQAGSHRMHVKQAAPKLHTYLCLGVSAALWILQRRWDDCFSHHSRVSSQLATSRGSLFLQVSVSRLMMCNNFIRVNIFWAPFPFSSCRLAGSVNTSGSTAPSFSVSTAVFQRETWRICWISIPWSCKWRKISISNVTEVSRRFKVFTRDPSQPVDTSLESAVTHMP